MPDSLGGKRMAIYVAELARAGMTPNWLPGVVPRCVPVESKSNQHGERSTTVVVGIERVLHRGRWRSIEVLANPVTWQPHPEQIASARRGYDDWWQALDCVRDGLVVGGMVREVEVTAAMPKWGFGGKPVAKGGKLSFSHANCTRSRFRLLPFQSPPVERVQPQRT